MPNPRNVRNFWVEVQVDGRVGKVETGPVSKDGGMLITLQVRSDGGIVTALRVMCRALPDGTLIIDAEPRVPIDEAVQQNATPGEFRIKSKR